MLVRAGVKAPPLSFSVYVGQVHVLYTSSEILNSLLVQHHPCGALAPEAVTEDKSAGWERESTGSAIQCPWGMTNIFC